MIKPANEDELIRKFERVWERYGRTPSVFCAFRNLIHFSYRQAPRDFPWRRTREPYRIVVSEMMLQQTQTGRVAGKYEEFIERFPTFTALADAPLREVLAVWQGLGYNRRALMLKRLAETVKTEYGGNLPAAERELRKLPGIGRATAAAVAAFAFGKPSILIETNIRRVFIHFFFHESGNVTDREIESLVEDTLDRSDPRTWYYALMDYGAKLARQVPNPNRRSAHYTKQSAFKGSQRQFRGMVIRHLLGGDVLTAGEMAKALRVPSDMLRVTLENLEAEGLVSRKGHRWRIA